VYVNAKLIPLNPVQELVEGDIKGSCGGGEFKYDIFDTL
jgi:hypothetical protein